MKAKQTVFKLVHVGGGEVWEIWEAEGKGVRLLRVVAPALLDRAVKEDPNFITRWWRARKNRPVIGAPSGTVACRSIRLVKKLGPQLFAR